MGDRAGSSTVTNLSRGISRSDGEEQAIARPSTSSSFSSITRDSLDFTAGKMDELVSRLEIENKIKDGAENLLQVLEARKFKDHKEANRRKQVETEIDTVNQKIAAIQSEMETLTIPVQGKLNTNGKVRAAGQFVEGPVVLKSTPQELPLRAEDNDSASSTYSLADLVQSLDEPGLDPDFYIHKANSLVAHLKRHPTLREDLAWSAFGPVLQFLLRHRKSEVCAAGYRVAQYSLTEVQSIQILRSLQMDFYIIHSLGRDSSCLAEREQALRLVRAVLEIPTGIKQLSQGVVRAIIACAEQGDDKLHRICVETLAELLVADARLVMRAGGDRILLQVLSEGPLELADCVVHAYLYLLDAPRSRRYVRAGTDVESLLAAFTDAQFGAHSHEDRVRSAASVLASILSTWSGLFVLTMYNMRSLRSLMESLKAPSFHVQDALMDLVLSALRIKSPSWSGSFLAGRRLTTFGRAGPLKTPRADTLSVTSKGRPGEHDLVKQYTSLLMAAFIEAGLVENLLHLTTIEDPTITRKATLVLSETLQLARSVLPKRINEKVQSLPTLFHRASSFDLTDRFQASSTVYQMDSIYRTNARSLPSRQILRNASSKGGSRVVENVKLKLNSQIDDAHFRTLLMDTQVLNTKNHTKWKWDLLSQLLQGPLMNPKRLDEAIRVTKFMKRLVSFYRPFKHRFSDIKNTKPNQRYVRVGRQLLTTLLASADGVKYLSENKLLRQISECLAQLDPMSGITSNAPLFSKQRLEETLTSGYFALLGTLSCDPNGMLMMERWKMFNMLYHISELRSRNDMIIKVLVELDYHRHGHPRIILAKTLTSGQKDVRMILTKHLRILIDASEADQDDDTSGWAIKLLVTQLYDPDMEVCEVAVHLLGEICSITAHLEFLVTCRPALDHLGEIGAPLLLRFLSTSVGFHYLQEVDYIGREMDDWFHGRNEGYVTVVEAALAHAFDRPFDGRNRPTCPVPPHFYGELAKTREGCQLLCEKRHFEEFAAFVEAHASVSSEEDLDADVLLKLKGCLWAVGNIGATDGGAPLLKSSGVAPHIVSIAQNSTHFSLKGTAFFVLGLLSASFLGRRILEQQEWQSVTDVFGEPRCICLPTRLAAFLSLQPWAFDIPEVDGPVVDQTQQQEPPPPLDAVDEQTLIAVSNLSNHILANEASKHLAMLKATQEERFEQWELHQRVMQLLGSYRYRQPVRRFILELFDPALGQRT